MADLTITETALGDGRIRYELGRPNWEARRIPDIRSPGADRQIAGARLIDVVLLGDGFTAGVASSVTRSSDWLEALYAIDVYERFAGCIRIRALYTPSTERASAARGSYYGCPIAPDGRHRPGRRLVAGGRRAQRRVPRGALGIGGHVRRRSTCAATRTT